jgi:hypothetical protein
MTRSVIELSFGGKNKQVAFLEYRLILGINRKTVGKIEELYPYVLREQRLDSYIALYANAFGNRGVVGVCINPTKQSVFGFVDNLVCSGQNEFVVSANFTLITIRNGETFGKIQMNGCRLGGRAVFNGHCYAERYRFNGFFESEKSECVRVCRSSL